MDKLRNLISPGKDQDDQLLYRTEGSAEGSPANTGKVAGEGSHFHDNTSGVPGTTTSRANPTASATNPEAAHSSRLTDPSTTAATSGSHVSRNTEPTGHTSTHDTTPSQRTHENPATTAASKAWKSHEGGTSDDSGPNMPGGFPGDSNPYRTSQLDPRVDSSTRGTSVAQHSTPSHPATKTDYSGPRQTGNSGGTAGALPTHEKSQDNNSHLGRDAAIAAGAATGGSALTGRDHDNGRDSTSQSIAHPSSTSSSTHPTTSASSQPSRNTTGPTTGDSKQEWSNLYDHTAGTIPGTSSTGATGHGTGNPQTHGTTGVNAPAGHDTSASNTARNAVDTTGQSSAIPDSQKSSQERGGITGAAAGAFAAGAAALGFGQQNKPARDDTAPTRSSAGDHSIGTNPTDHNVTGTSSSGTGSTDRGITGSTGTGPTSSGATGHDVTGASGTSPSGTGSTGHGITGTGLTGSGPTGTSSASVPSRADATSSSSAPHDSSLHRSSHPEGTRTGVTEGNTSRQDASSSGGGILGKAASAVTAGAAATGLTKHEPSRHGDEAKTRSTGPDSSERETHHTPWHAEPGDPSEREHGKDVSSAVRPTHGSVKAPSFLKELNNNPSTEPSGVAAPSSHPTQPMKEGGTAYDHPESVADQSSSNKANTAAGVGAAGVAAHEAGRHHDTTEPTHATQHHSIGGQNPAVHDSRSTPRSVQEQNRDHESHHHGRDAALGGGAAAAGGAAYGAAHHQHGDRTGDHASPAYDNQRFAPSTSTGTSHHPTTGSAAVPSSTSSGPSQLSQPSQTHDHGARDTALGGGLGATASHALGRDRHEPAPPRQPVAPSDPRAAVAPKEPSQTYYGAATTGPDPLRGHHHDHHEQREDNSHLGRNLGAGTAAGVGAGTLAHELSDRKHAEPHRDGMPQQTGHFQPTTQTHQTGSSQPTTQPHQSTYPPQTSQLDHVSYPDRTAHPAQSSHQPSHHQQEKLHRDEDSHTGRNLATGAAVGAGAGATGHELSKKQAEHAEKEHLAEQRAREKELVEHQKAHDKELAREHKEHEKQVEKEHKAAEKAHVKEEKKHEKDLAKQHEKEEKEHHKLLVAQQKDHEAHEKELARKRELEEQEHRKLAAAREHEAKKAAGHNAAPAGVVAAPHDHDHKAHDHEARKIEEEEHDKEKKPGLLQRILHPHRHKDDEHHDVAPTSDNAGGMSAAEGNTGSVAGGSAYDYDQQHGRGALHEHDGHGLGEKHGRNVLHKDPPSGISAAGGHETQYGERPTEGYASQVTGGTGTTALAQGNQGPQGSHLSAAGNKLDPSVHDTPSSGTRPTY